MRKQRRYSGGFTLIELMIAVAIIGIVAAPLAAMIMNARNLSENQHRLTRAVARLSKEAEALKAGKVPPEDEFRIVRINIYSADEPHPYNEVVERTMEPLGDTGLVAHRISVSFDLVNGKKKTVETVVLRRER